MVNSASVSRRSLLAGVGGVSVLALTGRASAQPGPAVSPLTAYGRLPAVQYPALSPDGKRVAFISDGTGASRILTDYSTATGKIAAVGIGSAPLNHLSWADNESVMVVATEVVHSGPIDAGFSVGGFINIPTGKQIHLFRYSGLVHPDYSTSYKRVRIDNSNRMSVPHYSDDEETTRITNANGLFSVSIASGSAFAMDVDGFPIRNWAVRPDGSVVGRDEYNEDTKVWTVRYRGPDGWRPIATVKEPIDPPALYGLGRDGKSLLVRFNAGALAGKYVEMAPDGSLSAPFALDRDDHYPLFDNRTYALAGFANSRTIDTYTIFEPELKAALERVQQSLPGRRTYLVGVGDDPRYCLVLSESGSDGGSVLWFDFVDGSYDSIGAVYPELTSAGVGKQTAITCTAADGLPLPAFLTLPPGREARGLPVVVLPHGGYGAFDSEGFDWLAQAIASRGYAVLQPNYRGSGGYSHDFEAKGYGEAAGKILSDMEDALAELVRQGVADPARTAVAGRGFGGYLALAGVSLKKNAYRCAIAIDGISDVPAYFKRQDERYGFDSDASGLMYIKRYFGDDKRWRDISPVAHAADVTCPVLLVHSEDNVEVFPRQSDGMQKALSRAGKTAEFVLLKGEDPSLARAATRLQALQAVVTFLEKHNPAT